MSIIKKEELFPIGEKHKKIFKKMGTLFFWKTQFKKF